MLQGKAVCMERLAAESGEFRLGHRRELARFGLEAGAISHVAKQRMAEVTQVHPDLVGAAGLQFECEARCDRLAVAAGKALEPAPMGDRFAAALAHRHLFTGARMTRDRLADRA